MISSNNRYSPSGWAACCWSARSLAAGPRQPCAQAAAPAPAAASRRRQLSPSPAPAPAPAPQRPGVIRSIRVVGAERLEPETVRSYANLVPGQAYNAETLDQALKDLYATELFADVVITGADTGNLVITVRENPVINRIVLEGNKRHQGRQDHCRRSSSRRARSSPARRSAPTSTGSSSCTAARAASPPRSSRRSSSSTRTASTWCSRSTKATSPRSARSTSSATRNSPTAACARKCSPRRPAACSASSSRTTATIPTALPPTSRSCAPST